MMKNFKFLLLLWALSLILFGGIACKKDNAEKLPPATQKGANTFGFLLNGKVWLPKTPFLKSSEKLHISYYPNNNGGTLSISAKRYFDNGGFQSISISSSNITSVGVYPIAIDKAVIYYYDTNSCEYHWNDNSKMQGTLTITKLDLTNYIISGTFVFKLEKEGCPTINATQGRFDMKIE